MNTDLVVLAFSGGLDTSFCVKYLQQEKRLRVHSVIVNTGGFSAEELHAIEKRAYQLGVEKHIVIDETTRYYETCLKYLVFGNVLKNGTYPLSVSAERVFQANAIARYAEQVGAQYIAHGSTGAGNDQVRFDVAFHILVPHIPVLTPIRELKLSREEEIEFLKKNGFEEDFQKAIYSINKGLWGTTIGGRETLTSDQFLPEHAFPSQCTKTEPIEIELTFVHGELRGAGGRQYDNPVDAIQWLQQLAEQYAIGRDIHIGDTIIGIKGRVGFEAAAPLIIIKAHHTLEKHTLTKMQLSVKDQLALTYGQMLHEGQFLDPVMRSIEKLFEDTQRSVSGTVRVYLAPYRFHVVGISSPHDMMSSRFGKYGEMNNTWSGDDVRGFSKILSNQAMIHAAVNKEL